MVKIMGSKTHGQAHVPDRSQHCTVFVLCDVNICNMLILEIITAMRNFIIKMIRKLGALLLKVNTNCWEWVPESVKKSRFGLLWGRWIFRLVEVRGGRNQLTTTYFFRSRAEIYQWLNIVDNLMPAPELNISIVGCSEGAEVYTLVYAIRKRFPSLNLHIHGYDINEAAVTTAKEARYPSDSQLLSKMTAEEQADLFDTDGEFSRVKPMYREGITWEWQDPTKDPNLSSLPKQDIVLANRLLFHMYRDEQRQTLAAIATMVRPGGYLLVSGVDLDIRTKLAKKNGWVPITDLVEEIHTGDETMTIDWPLKYWGLEPLDKNQKDWPLRYCPVFQIPYSCSSG